MTPLVLLVGFLGAGKTSLLRKLVPLLRTKGTRPSIILNDYQNARVDAELFRELEAIVTPISGSCVCCGSREELLEAMDAHEHSAGGILLVETNGTTDAEELVTLLAADPRLRDFSLPFQISVVDAKRWQKRFWHNSLEADQVATASVIYLGHRDEVDEERVDKVLASLAATKAVLPPLDLEEIAGELASLVTECAQQPQRVIHSACESCGHNHDHEHGHNHEHEHEHEHEQEKDPHHHDRSLHHFAAVETEIPAVVNRRVFENALRALPPEILRAKGLVRFEEDPEVLHIFQKIGQFDEVQTAPLEGDPVTNQTLAVFIGSRIGEDFVGTFLRVLSPGVTK
jgi:G3E family GTPase